MEVENVEKKKFNVMPKLRFQQFEGDWRNMKLKNMAEINPKTTELPNEFVYIDLESVTKGILVKEETIIKENAPSRAQRVLESQDILYQTVRPYQKNNFFFDKIGKYVASTGYAQLKAKEVPKFLYQFLHTTPFVNLVNRWSTGTSYPAISPSELGKIRVHLPSFSEQQKIASFLSAVDKKIQHLTRKKELLETYKKGVMHQLFSQEIRFKDEVGNNFPEWEEKKLGELATFSKGKGISKDDILEDGLNPCIRYGQLYTTYKETIEHTISKTNVPKKKLVLSEAGDVIIPASGETQIDIATASCVLKEGIALGGDLNIIRGSFNGVFLAYYLNAHLKTDIARLSQGSSVIHLYATQLKNLKLEIPAIEEQQKIAEFLSAIDKKIEAVSQQIEKTHSFKKGLLQQMFI